ncbi:MAG: hypothetical protein R6U43_02750 [Candidatus Krumholzibacteriales bacterium]
MKDENKQMFREQVDDHVKKLVSMLEHSSGENVDGGVIDRICLATRLLEGSAAMLQLSSWSEMLTLFREMIEKSGGRTLDENLSQVISEIIEAEETIINKVESGGIESCNDSDLFEGIRDEILFLTSEYDASMPQEKSGSGVQVVYFKEKGDDNGFEIINSMVDVLDKINQELILRKDNRDKGNNNDLNNLWGEGRFYMDIVDGIVKRVAGPGGENSSPVSSQVLLNTIDEIVDIYSKMKGWSLEFHIRSDDFSMDSDIGADLFSVIEKCIFDINELSLKNGDQDLDLELVISNKGSYLETAVSDNYRSNSVIDNVDIAAYYPGLISIRNILRKWQGLLWVDRSLKEGERFRFTMPAGREKTDYRVISAGGTEVAVLSRCIETVTEFHEKKVTMENNRYYFDSLSGKVPVFSIDELASDELNADYDFNYMLVFGIAEERVAVLCENEGYRIETVPEQSVEESQLSISEISLQIGENSFPVLDTAMILENLDSMQEKSLSYAAPVSSDDTGIA